MQPYLVGSRCACQSDLSFHLWRRHESVLANKRKKFVSLHKTLVCNFFQQFFHTLKMILLNKLLLTLNAQYWPWRFSRVCYCFNLHDNEGSIFSCAAQRAMHPGQNWVFIYDWHMYLNTTCDHFNQIYWVVLSCGLVCFSIVCFSFLNLNLSTISSNKDQ